MSNDYLYQLKVDAIRWNEYGVTLEMRDGPRTVDLGPLPLTAGFMPWKPGQMIDVRVSVVGQDLSP